MPTTENYFHGPLIEQGQTISTVAITPATTPIGVVVTADDADASVFPELSLVSVTPDLIAKAGSTGTLVNVLNAIYGQSIVPNIIVVRVPTSTDLAEQSAYVAEGASLLAQAQSQFDLIPEILGAPGLDDADEVITALIEVADKIGGFVYAAVRGANRAALLAVRNRFSSKRLMLIWPEFERLGSIVHATAVALGLRSKIDADTSLGGRAKTLSNVPLETNFSSDLRISTPVDYFGRDSEGNFLNASHITTLRREQGVRFWGNRTTATDPLWHYESAVRMADYIAKRIHFHEFAQTDGLITQQQIDHRIEMIQLEIDALVRNGQLLTGSRVIKHPSLNNTAALAEGRTWLYADFTVPPPNEQPGVVLRITQDYLFNLLAA
ncbi:phage tail sheath subtilisin-like domain-containing protein [uncultured Thiothrix sp.]|uniref:phage tail sheath subtilisin-like domain-containing protein n=1 Tax=uncultured Thiothrix sp. TaxID=223185 RepID=UPI0026079EA8|nr:phage tail sheath subtilisin-like domain-containing protein [uncultured Thiothrix sp.]